MPYDHSTKIGNQGDVVKHAVLYSSIVSKLQDAREDSTFRYAESHCGRAAYILPNGGAWDDGIGVLSRKSNESLAVAPMLQEYREAMLAKRIDVGQKRSVQDSTRPQLSIPI